MSRHPIGAEAEFGEPTSLSEADFDSRIVVTVLENLAEYDREPFKRELAPRSSDAEYSRFTRAHDHVSVARKESGVVEITPAKGVREGYQGITEAIITLREDEIPARLAAALREAFKQCL